MSPRNVPIRRRSLAGRWFALLVGFTLLSPIGWAQIVYLNEMGMTGHAPFLHVGNAPYDTSDPAYDFSTTKRNWVASSQSYYTIDPVTGFASTPSILPPSVKLTTDSHIVFAGRNTSDHIALILGFRKILYVVSLSGPTPVMGGPLDGVSVPMALVSSMAAADRNHLSAITDGSFQTIDIATGLTTTIDALKFDGGTGPRHFSNYESAGEGNGTFYHAYGPNGLLYLLDYGNNRMQILDPDNAFAYVSEFAFHPGVTTKNMQFAIGLNGNIYLGDGLGGGTTYDADGDFLNTFALPEPMPLDEPGAQPHITTDASGAVYVLDETGNHRYRDLSVVPEPSVTVILMGSSLALASARRRGRKEKAVGR